jgi:hypothetical protein
MRSNPAASFPFYFSPGTPGEGRVRVLLITLVALVAGCQSIRVADSTLPTLSGNEPQTQLDFWHTLATKDLVTNDEAFHGLLLFIDNSDSSQTYDDRVETLKARKLLPKNFNRPADQALTRGALAVPLVNHLRLNRGVTLSLLRNNDRYATRELEYQNIYPTSSTNQLFTGAAFVGVIGKAQDYLSGDPSQYPAAMLPNDIAVALGRAPQPIAEPQDEFISPIFAFLQPDNLALRPTTTTSTAPVRRAVISKVEGFAAYRESDSAEWKPAVNGIELNEQAELRTGPKGAIQLIIEPDQTVAIDRLTTVKLLRIFTDGAKAATDIGIKYGRTRYDLEGGGIEHQSTLRSPNATLAVRGTRVSLFDQAPFTPQAISLTGRAEFQGFRKRAVGFGAPGQGRTRVTTEEQNPGALAIQESTIDPILPGARTQSELPLVQNLISRGATISSVPDLDIPVVRGGVPPTDAQLLSLLPGRLNFVVRWNGNANLNLAVSTPSTAAQAGGELIYSIPGFTSSPSGGRTAFDHRGGPNGGIEIVFFEKNFPTGIYALAAPSDSSALVSATLQGFLDGQPLQMFDGLTISDRVTQQVGNPAPGPALALAAVGASFPFAPPPGPPEIPSFPARLSSVKKPINLLNPPPALMVGPKQSKKR